jgi:hypothetical protein
MALGSDIASENRARYLPTVFTFLHVSAEALMFRAGYLTLVGRRKLNGRQFYKLRFPNEGVRKSLHDARLGNISAGFAAAVA